GAASTALVEQRGGHVDCEQVSHVRREGERERPRPGAEIERVLVALRLDERADGLSECLAPALLELAQAGCGSTPAIVGQAATPPLSSRSCLLRVLRRS